MNKEQQKKLITEIMEDDEKDGLYELGDKQSQIVTAVEFLFENWPILNAQLPPSLIEHVKAVEMENIVKAYEAGWKNGTLKKSPSFGFDYYHDTYNQ